MGVGRMTPTARTLRLLRSLGYIGAVVEQWVPYTRTRRDAFGFCDVIAVHPQWPGTLFVQATSASNHSARRKKLAALSAVEVVKMAGNRVQIISWGKRKPRGQRRPIWTARIEEV